MTAKNSVYIVALLGIGKNFPNRPRHQILAEAKLGNEVLLSDPVEHIENPHFVQELAWEEDKKGLHQHRLHRSVVKLHFYAVDKKSKAKELIGYTVLDIRSATTKRRQKFCPLLNNKYQKFKPHVKVGIFIDENVPAPIPQPSPVKTSELRPVLDKDGKVFQIGSTDQATERFIMSVVIAFAANLDNLPLKPDSTLVLSKGFMFYYTLLGNSILTNSFSSLTNPEFVAERASVYIRSSVELLRQFFSSQPGIEVHLCCGDKSLAYCTVKLTELLPADSVEIFMKPVVVNGAFELIPSSGKKVEATEEKSPVVGVSVELRLDPMFHAPTEENKSTPQKQKTPPKSSPKLNRPKRAITPPEAELTRVEEPKVDFKEPEPEESSAHYYTCTINIRDIRNLNIKETMNIHVRYMYNFFGSPSPIVTRPPVEVSRGSERTLPNGYCMFEFAASPQQVAKQFTNVPLLLEVWSYDANLGVDHLFAVGHFQISDLLLVEKYKISVPNGEVLKQTIVQAVKLFSSSTITKPKVSESEILGILDVQITLEDRGPMPIQVLESIKAQSPNKLNSPKHAEIVSNSPTQSSSVQKSSNLAAGDTMNVHRQTKEYKAAVELEMWRDLQQTLFEKQLKEKEAKHLESLSREFQLKEKEREVTLSKRLDDCSKLEKEFEKKLKELEAREKVLVKREQELERKQLDFSHQHQLKMDALSDAGNRMQTDIDQRLQLEKTRYNTLEELLARTREELTESERKRQVLEDKIVQMRLAESDKPESKLHAQISILTLEKSELERKMEQANRSKTHYKQQWGKALKELAKMKEGLQLNAKENLQRQQAELEHMRLRYLAAEERDLMTSDQSQLKAFKQQLDELKKPVSPSKSDRSPPRSRNKNVNENHLSSTSKKPLQVSFERTAYKPNPNSLLEDHVTRLIEERDTLYRTGVYTSQDRIITELDRQIREAIAKRDQNLAHSSLSDHFSPGSTTT